MYPPLRSLGDKGFYASSEFEAPLATQAACVPRDQTVDDFKDRRWNSKTLWISNSVSHRLVHAREGNDAHDFEGGRYETHGTKAAVMAVCALASRLKM